PADSLLVAVTASPLPERMARLRPRPAGPNQEWKLGGIALRKVVRCRDGDDVNRVAGAQGGERIASRRQQTADEHLHLVLENQFLHFGDAGIRLALLVLDDEFHLRAGEIALYFVEIHLKAINHILADLREYASRWREKTDAQLFGAQARAKSE